MVRELSFVEIPQVSGGVAPAVAACAIGAVTQGGSAVLADNWTWGGLITSAGAGCAVGLLGFVGALSTTAGRVGVALGIAGEWAIVAAENHANTPSTHDDANDPPDGKKNSHTKTK